MTATNDTTTNADFTGPIDYAALYEEQREQNAQLQGVLAATRSQAVASSPAFNQKPVISAERFRATVGAAALHGMTRDQKLRGMGCADPSTISDDGLKALFGRGNTGTLSQDLFRSNPGKYRQLKAYAEILNIYGG